jgi:hypothetical protein
MKQHKVVDENNIELKNTIELKKKNSYCLLQEILKRSDCIHLTLIEATHYSIKVI